MTTQVERVFEETNNRLAREVVERRKAERRLEGLHRRRRRRKRLVVVAIALVVVGVWIVL